MAGCSDYGCNCQINAGAGLVITGTGAPGRPYVIELDGGLGSSLSVEDTPTVDLILRGSGNPVDPFVLSAKATIALTALSDVSDPQGGPAIGDVPVWVSSGPAAHWEFQPPPANPAGSVNVGVGLSGTGAIGDPIVVQLVGTSEGGSVGGLEVYVDSAGNLRAVPPAGETVTWEDVGFKPTDFPTSPSSFSGTLPVSKGGTGETSLSSVTVGNASEVGGHKIFVSSTTPAGASVNDLWFY